jgi:hypothetical protein
MRKQMISRPQIPNDQSWLNLEALAHIELTSEDPAHTIETALTDTGPGWRAAEPGQQTIRILFDEPQRIRRIRLVFDEGGQERTQQFVLRWSAAGPPNREIVRQQYNFSPPETPREVEDYGVDLDGLTALELIITPDISGRPAFASVAQLRLA